ncbi:hypothetical protein [Bacillus sp. FJAT-47783]|uniref:hypothetical protein n=1 Tax=Bacillus sp. FJAT-47783 TaxID=2922712 RepID=UPI001FACBCB4|nr:hypothetical protein [Bacillus sp. FJAT-47783]
MKSIVAKVIALRKLEELEQQLEQLEMKLLEKTYEQATQPFTEISKRIERHDHSIQDFNRCVEDLNIQSFMKKELNPSNTVSLNPSY